MTTTKTMPATMKTKADDEYDYILGQTEQRQRLRLENDEANNDDINDGNSE
jgi:hypothetical protein